VRPSVFSIGVGAALAFVTANGALRAQEGKAGRFLSPVDGARLDPGATVRVVWERPLRASSAREVELVLSLDGGRTFPVRLTRDLSPDTNAVLWRVPALPTRAARVALRVGEDEEPADETIELVGGVFEIAEETALAPEAIHRVGGEWRTEAALDGAVPPNAPDDLEPGIPDAIRALRDRDDALDSRRAERIADPASPSIGRARPPLAAAPAAGPPARLPRPPFPLRP
jgi:hypothetical protein